MKIQIKNSVFETNSSSTHTIAVSQTLYENTKIHEIDIYDKFNLGETFCFGRVTDLHNSVGRRIAYLVIAWLDYMYSEDKSIAVKKKKRESFYNKIINIVLKYNKPEDWYVELESEKIASMLKNMFQAIEHDSFCRIEGYKPVYKNFEKNPFNESGHEIYFGIDHCGNTKKFIEFVISDDKTLERWIVDQNSFVFSGGDEYYGFYMKQVGLEFDYDSDEEFFKKAKKTAKKLKLDVFYKGN